MIGSETDASWIETSHNWFSDHAELFAFALLLLLIVQSLRLLVLRSAAGRRIARHRRQGVGAELAAKKLLKGAGFRTIQEQVTGGYQMLVDGAGTSVHLRADFLVERYRKRYIAEVKSGFESSKVTTRATRRQLLEYCLAFDVQGILLVDMHRSQILEISFPSMKT